MGWHGWPSGQLINPDPSWHSRARSGARREFHGEHHNTGIDRGLYAATAKTGKKTFEAGVGRDGDGSGDRGAFTNGDELFPLVDVYWMPVLEHLWFSLTGAEFTEVVTLGIKTGELEKCACGLLRLLG